MKIGSAKVESIKLSLMKKESDINNIGEAEYTPFISATFKMPQEYLDESPGDLNGKYGKEYLKSLLHAIFEDLTSKNTQYDVDSLGIWIKTSERLIENAIALQTLTDIKEYSKEDVDPLYEFFKMTLS